MNIFVRTEEVKKDAIGQPLDSFLKKYSGQTTDAALTKAYNSIRTQNNSWVMPIEEQAKLVQPQIAARATKTDKSIKPAKEQIAKTSTGEAPKGAKSARIAALHIEGKTIKEVMSIMQEEGTPVVYSQVHQIFKKLNPQKS